ncbi:uncharacterized protein ccdc175 [Genypterus blacodes]|uniref:uncharacterized protein ccdc175 n=1 Tax=Genypterus blacodes TaxID=154954 RepID=UPI003F7628A4
MASCLVPDFPAVLVALGHLKELDKELRDEGHRFVPEASLHLSEVAAAVSELEAARRVAHEQLEVETIENSKLRHQILNVREQMSRVIMADVAAARENNAEEIEQLSGDLKAVSQRQEDVAERQEVLLRQNELLGPERDEARARHEGEVAALNCQIDQKFDLQNQLRKTREQVEELESCVADVQQRKLTAQEEVTLQRRALAGRKDDLCRELERIMEDVQQQMHVNNSRRKELDAVNVKKRDAQVRHGELTGHVAQLESTERGLEASRGRCEEQLGEEIQEHRKLEEQRETLEEDLCELRGRLCNTARRLQEDIARAEVKMEEGRTSRRIRHDTLAQVSQRFKSQHKEENKARAEHSGVSLRLERSKVQLEERVASIVKHRKERIEMEEQSRHLQQTDLIHRGHFENHLRELKSLLDAEKKTVAQFEEEKQRISLQLEEARRKQEEREAKISSETSSTRRRYEHLQREEASLPQGRSTSAAMESLTSCITQSEAEFRQTENECQQETQRCTAKTEQVVRSSNEKQREVEKEEEALKEVEAKFKEEQCNHERLQTLTSELRSRQEELQVWIQRLTEDTSALLRPGDQRKAELQAQRERHADLLHQRASELRSIEVSIYQSSVKLEQVNMENSRLHLQNTQMKENVSRAEKNEGRYQLEVQRLDEDAEALLGDLEAAWREDVQLIQHRQAADGVLLASMNLLLGQLKKRRRGLEDVGTLLHTHLLDFTKRIGGHHNSVCQQ